MVIGTVCTCVLFVSWGSQRSMTGKDTQWLSVLYVRVYCLWAEDRKDLRQLRILSGYQYCVCMLFVSWGSPRSMAGEDSQWLSVLSVCVCLRACMRVYELCVCACASPHSSELLPIPPHMCFLGLPYRLIKQQDVVDCPHLLCYNVVYYS